MLPPNKQFSEADVLKGLLNSYAWFVCSQSSVELAADPGPAPPRSRCRNLEDARRRDWVQGFLRTAEMRPPSKFGRF